MASFRYTFLFVYVGCGGFKVHILYRYLCLTEEKITGETLLHQDIACHSEITGRKGAASLVKPSRTYGENICIENQSYPAVVTVPFLLPEPLAT